MTHAYDEICLERASDTLGRMLDYSVYSLRYDIPSMMNLFIASGAAARFERGDIRTITGMSGIELAYDVLEKSGLSFDRTQPRYTKSLSAEYWYGYVLAQIQWNTSTSFARITQAYTSQSFISEYGKNRLAFLDSLSLDISEEKRKSEIKAFGIKAANKEVSQYLERLQSGYANKPQRIYTESIRSEQAERLQSEHSKKLQNNSMEGIQNRSPGKSTSTAAISAKRPASISANSSAPVSAKGSFAVSDKGSATPTVAAHKLKKIRLLNGLSQSELATASGIPVRTIQQYEQGQKDLAKARAEYLIALARALNCDPATLLID